jgi:glycosyltransferase involved in cell wall biosynthesis
MTMPDRPRIFVLKPGEGWIVDTMGWDFEKRTQLSVTNDPGQADIIWLLGSWCWEQVIDYTRGRTVVCTVHHIVPEKFDVLQFLARERYCNIRAYFVYTDETADIIKRHSNIPIIRTPHWVDLERWYPESKHDARRFLGISDSEFVVGSFQRDTEGWDLTSPKLEKGPDILCDLIERINSVRPVTVLLGGWRREYVIRRLQAAGVSYIFKELPPQETVRKMYASCDMYLCTARHEGGPQAILEASAMRVPIFSTPVGIARDVLHPAHIINPSVWMPGEIDPAAVEHSFAQAAERAPDLLIPAYDHTLAALHEMAQN